MLLLQLLFASFTREFLLTDEIPDCYILVILAIPLCPVIWGVFLFEFTILFVGEDEGDTLILLGFWILFAPLNILTSFVYLVDSIGWSHYY